jgi:predicted dehydrogenase
VSLRAAVIGLGAIGRHHARLLSRMPGVSLVATCDAELARAREHAHGAGCVAVASVESLPAALDLAVVATPTVTHRPLAEPLLRRGVSCLVEKPIAATLEDADAIVAAAREGGAVLVVGHAERFNPGLARARELVRTPLFVESHRLGGFPERSLDVDVVLDLMIHDLDLLLWLAGGELVDVAAIGVPVLTPMVDIANARVRLSSGCTANVTASRVSADVVRKLRVFQEDVYVSVDLFDQSAEVFRLVPRCGPRPDLERVRVGRAEGAPKEETLAHELHAFVRAVRREAPPAVSGAEGRRALHAALAVLQAMEAHEAWRRGLAGPAPR